MIQYVQTRGIAILIIICLTSVFTLDEALAENSVYDSYQLDVNNQQEGDEGGEGRLEQPSQLEEHPFSSTEKNELGFFLLLKIVVYLVIIIVMIYGLIRFLASRQKNLGGQQLFQTLGGISLGSNKSLQLVKVGNTYYLLGVAEHISLIKEITASEEIAKLETDLAKQETVIPKSFSQLLGRKAINKEEGATSSFQNMLMESLQEQKRKRTNVERSWARSRDNNEEDTST